MTCIFIDYKIILKPSSKPTPSSTLLKSLIHCTILMSKLGKMLHFLHTLYNSFRVVTLSSFQSFTIKSIFVEIGILLSSKLLNTISFMLLFFYCVFILKPIYKTSFQSYQSHDYHYSDQPEELNDCYLAVSRLTHCLVACCHVMYQIFVLLHVLDPMIHIHRNDYIWS